MAVDFLSWITLWIKVIFNRIIDYVAVFFHGSFEFYFVLGFIALFTYIMFKWIYDAVGTK